MDTMEFLQTVMKTFEPSPDFEGMAKLPEREEDITIVPKLYSNISEWHSKKYGVTREQYAMCASLMTVQGAKHPLSITKRPQSLERVLKARPVAEMVASLECARLADGAAVIIVASSDFLEKRLSDEHLKRRVKIVGCGETSGCLISSDNITED